MIKGEEFQVGEIFRIYDPDMSWSDRLNERMQELGWKKAELARRSGVPYDSINKYLRGDIEQPRGDTLEKIAVAVGKSALWLREGIDSPTETTGTVSGPVPMPAGALPFAGVARAGLWLPVDELYSQDESDHHAPPSIPRHPAYLHLPQHGYLIEGDSMNEAGMLDGMWAVATTYLDYVDQVGELGNGNYVIVQRLRAGGHERELTVKEVQFSRKGMRLVPRSTNSVHKEFVIPLDHDADSDEETVSIIGVVLWVVKDMDPRAR